MSENNHKKTICAEYGELLQGIFNSQNQQIEIKINCIKILLGTFAFIGILGFASIGLSSLCFIFICSLLPIISLIIITANFFHDLVYKERLKLGFFSSALKLEQKYLWLPEFHKSLLGEYKTQISPIRNQILFYLGCGIILFILSAIFMFFLSNFSHFYVNLSILIFFSILFISYYKFLFFYMKKTKILFLNENGEINSRQQRNFDEVNKRYLEILHAQGKKFIEHFSNLKMRYKNLPITILTALFIAIAYVIGSQESFFSSKNVLSEQQNFVHEHILYLISLITSLSVIGIKMIRYLDINVSHEQIRSLFKHIIDLEKIYKISKPYEIISKTLYQKNFDPVFIDFFYYGSINFGIIFLGSCILISHLRDYHSLLGIYCSLGIILSLLIWEIVDFIFLLKKKLILKK